MRRECLRLGLLTTSTTSPCIAGICPPSSVGTIFVVVPAPSANVSSQFVLDMERYEGISRSPDLKRFATIGPSPAVQTPFVSRRAGSSHSRFPPGHSSAATPTAAPCLPIQCLVPISPLEMLSTVTHCSPLLTPTLRKNVQTTSSLAS